MTWESEFAKKHPTFGDRLRALRKTYGETQDQLGKTIGVAGAAVSQWETNETQPTSDKIVKIAEHYRLDSIDWLISGRGPGPTLVGLSDMIERGFVTDAAEKFAKSKTKVAHHVAASSDLIFNSMGFISELAAHPKQEMQAQWRIPAHALPVAPAQNLTIVKSSIDLVAINKGDYLLVDREQRDLDQLGYWIASVKDWSAPLLIKTQLNKLKPILEIVSYSDLIIARKDISSVLGRVVARYGTAPLYP